MPKSVHECLQQLYSKSPKTGTTQMLSNLWIFKQIVLYPCNGRLHKNEKEDIINTHSKVENHRCWVISEKARSKNYVLYASWYMTFWKGKITETKKKKKSVISRSCVCVREWFVFIKWNYGISGDNGLLSVLTVVVVKPI